MSIPAGQAQTMLEALAFWAAAAPNAIALLAPDREPATYRELHGAVERLASDLRTLGLGREDGIALLFPEGPDLSLALLAAISVGIAIPLTWPNPDAEYRRILVSGHARAILTSTAIPTSALSTANHGLPVITFVSGPSRRIGDFRIDGCALGDPSPERRVEGNDVALILHSSGTTGRPKLVPRTHTCLVSTSCNLAAVRRVNVADRCVTSAKTASSQGITSLMLPIFAGASQVSIPELSLETLPTWLEAFRPTYLSTTPAILRVLAAGRGELRIAIQHSSIRCIHSASSPLASDELNQLEELLGIPILNGYGMSEATGIAGDPFPRVQRVPGAIGRPWCETRLLDDRGEPVGTNETGEIAVRGPRVFPRYLDDPEANADAFLPGGWFRTGDVGFLDDMGYLHLTGRLSEIINRGGVKVVPREVDDVLQGHPAVAEAAVFGVPDARLGEDVVAAVVLKPGQAATGRALRAWMLDRLAIHKAPRRIWFVDTLPRTTTGKVQRGELVRRWAEVRE